MRNLEGWKQWVITLALLGVAALAVTPIVDRQAQASYEPLFQRALVTFALARTLNGVISTIQGTELALQPAGVGLTLTPGEILDPVNDLVERFSWIMLGATVSLGVQQVLMDISRWWVLQGLAAVLAIWWLAVALGRRSDDQGTPVFLTRMLLIVLFLRFAVPLTLIANDALYEWFLEPRYTESSEVISAAGANLEQIGSREPAMAEPDEDMAGATLFGTIGRAVDNAADALDLRNRVEQIKQQAGAMIEHLIQLSVVFILQTGILPIAFLWLFLQLAKWTFRPLKN